MRFVILSTCEIPGFGGVKGPILNPQPLDLNVVRQLVSLGIDVREVMDDDSYRKISFNDGKILEAIDKGKNKVLPEAYVPVIEQHEDYIEEEIKVSTIIKPDLSENETEEPSDEVEPKHEDDLEETLEEDESDVDYEDEYDEDIEEEFELDELEETE